MDINYASTKNILHTYSKYAKSKLIIPTLQPPEIHINQKIETLRNNESRFYQAIFSNAYSVEDFNAQFAKLKTEMSNHDFDLLSNFAAEKLRPTLISRYGLSNINPKALQTIQIQGHVSKAKKQQEQLDKVWQQVFKRYGTIGDTTALTRIGNDIFINATEQVVADVVLQIYKYTLGAAARAVSPKNKQKKLQTGSTNIKKTPEYAELAKSLLEFKDFNVKLYAGNKFNERLGDSPFSITKEQFLALDVSSQIEIMDSVYEFIQSLLTSGSDMLHQAVDFVWKAQFSDINNFINVMDSAGIINMTVGSLGEFATAVAFKYISLLADVNNTSFSPSLSQELVNGQKPRSDLELLKGVGVQNKNFNLKDTLDSFVNSVEEQTEYIMPITANTTIHVADLASRLKYFKNGNESDFVAYLVNCRFNKTFGDEEEKNGRLKQVLQDLSQYRTEVMNMFISSEVEDTVSFYMVGQQFLIPCSYILEAIYRAGQQAAATPFILSGNKYRDDDKGFARTSKNKKGNVMAPKWKTYWNYDEGNWTPTDTNIERFNNLASTSVSVKSGISINNLLQEAYNESYQHIIKLF